MATLLPDHIPLLGCQPPDGAEMEAKAAVRSGVEAVVCQSISYRPRNDACAGRYSRESDGAHQEGAGDY